MNQIEHYRRFPALPSRRSGSAAERCRWPAECVATALVASISILSIHSPTWATTLSTHVDARAPSIELTSMPPWSQEGPVTGRVTGVDPSEHEIALYIHVEGSGWWSKPGNEAPPLRADSSGEFQFSLLPQGLDLHATIFVADLLPEGHRPSVAAGGSSLPTNASSLAQARVERFARTIEFAGRHWGVKSSPLPVGPGRNLFSHDAEHVWVDSRGRLHLTIQRAAAPGGKADGPAWWSTEVILLESLGYGTYWFVTEGGNEALDANATLGAFTWDSYGNGRTPGNPNREIDFEDSRWGDPERVSNSQAVVQPYSKPGNLVEYAIPSLSEGEGLTRWFVWEPERIEFVTQRGVCEPSERVEHPLLCWTYGPAPGLNQQIPTAGAERFRFNLWLNNVEIGGTPPPRPARDERIEVVVRDFRFTPLKRPERLLGPIHASAQWGSGWLDLAQSKDFSKGDRLRIALGGSASQVLVRFLADGDSPDSSRGLLGGAHRVPEGRVLEITLDRDRRAIRQISVHGGSRPWGVELGSTNGPATLESVDWIRVNASTPR